MIRVFAFYLENTVRCTKHRKEKYRPPAILLFRNGDPFKPLFEITTYPLDSHERINSRAASGTIFLPPSQRRKTHDTLHKRKRSSQNVIHFPLLEQVHRCTLHKKKKKTSQMHLAVLMLMEAIRGNEHKPV